MALLRVSEVVAERAGVARNSRTESWPRDKITVSVSTVTESMDHVSFSDDELIAIGVDPSDLNPFVFQEEHAELLVGQSIGHTALERQALGTVQRRHDGSASDGYRRGDQAFRD